MEVPTKKEFNECLLKNFGYFISCPLGIVGKLDSIKMEKIEILVDIVPFKNMSAVINQLIMSS